MNAKEKQQSTCIINLLSEAKEHGNQPVRTVSLTGTKILTCLQANESCIQNLDSSWAPVVLPTSCIQTVSLQLRGVTAVSMATKIQTQTGIVVTKILTCKTHASGEWILHLTPDYIPHTRPIPCIHLDSLQPTIPLPNHSQSTAPTHPHPWFSQPKDQPRVPPATLYESIAQWLDTDCKHS